MFKIGDLVKIKPNVWIDVGHNQYGYPKRNPGILKIINHFGNKYDFPITLENNFIGWSEAELIRVKNCKICKR